ncbi:MAG: cytochrome-c oxidase [Vulcanimicrobiaceae bacterium]
MGVTFLKVAVVYAVIGVVFGLVMGISGQLQFASVHAHLNLLGWATLALSGVIYVLFPAAGAHPIAKWQFWLQNLGLPVFVTGLVLIQSGNTATGIPLASTGSLLVIAGVVLLAINVFLNVRLREA